MENLELLKLRLQDKIGREIELYYEDGYAETGEVVSVGDESFKIKYKINSRVLIQEYQFSGIKLAGRNLVWDNYIDMYGTCPELSAKDFQEDDVLNRIKTHYPDPYWEM